MTQSPVSGAGDCATQCPYNAITMVPRKASRIQLAATGLASWFSLAPDELPSAVEQTD
ncbi:MAG: hypothetical protein U0X75_18115 [Acidobacteriota bacterium]